MSYRVRYTRAAREDLRRLYAFLLEHDLKAARRALDAIGKGIELLREFPFTCRKAAPDNPFLRELVIAFGAAGYSKSRTTKPSPSWRFATNAKTITSDKSCRAVPASSQRTFEALHRTRHNAHLKDFLPSTSIALKRAGSIDGDEFRRFAAPGYPRHALRQVQGPPDCRSAGALP